MNPDAAKSALERTIGSLDAALDSWGFWFSFWTALVVLGLLLEYGQHFKKLITERPFNWKLLWETVGGLLVVAGVTGELVVQFEAARVETDLRAANHELVGRLNQAAEEANREAKRAAERESANEKDAAKLRKEAEDERTARVAIEEALAWRRLTRELRTQIGARLTGFTGQTVSVWYNAGDAESAKFAGDIAATLQLAKWEVFEPATKLSFAESGRRLGTEPMVMDSGVDILSTGDLPSRGAADALAKVLTSFGYEAIRPSKVQPHRGAMVWVNVEVRPEGPQGIALLRRRRK